MLGKLGAVATVGVYASHLLLIGLCVAAGLAMLAPLTPFWKGRVVKREPRLSAATSAGAMAGSLVLGGLLAWAVPSVPPVFVALGRTLLQWNSLPAVLYTGEGINSWVAVVEWDDGYRSFHASGIGLATNYPLDLRLQLMLGHIATLTTAKPRSVLIIGHGAGVTAGSFIPYPEIERMCSTTELRQRRKVHGYPIPMRRETATGGPAPQGFGLPRPGAGLSDRRWPTTANRRAWTRRGPHGPSGWRARCART